MTDGELTVVAAAGTSQAPIAAGKSYFRAAGVEHDVRNDSGRSCSWRWSASDDRGSVPQQLYSC
jgi:hypothetical protein